MGKNCFLWPFPIFLKTGILFNFKESQLVMEFYGHNKIQIMAKILLILKINYNEKY